MRLLFLLVSFFTLFIFLYMILSPFKSGFYMPTPAAFPSPIPTPQFCGGIAGLPCPDSFTCRLEDTYPDAGGTCIPDQSVSQDCQLGGCNSEICQDKDSELSVSICIADPKYECLKYAACEKQKHGKCGWTYLPEYNTCLQNIKNNDPLLN